MMSCSDSKIEQKGASPAYLRIVAIWSRRPVRILWRVGLVADVPEDLVARRVEQRVQRDGDLAGAEVRAEVPADLAHGVDQQLADLLGDLLELVVGEPVEVGGAVDAVEDAGHEGRVKMKSVMRSSSSAPPGAAWASALRALRCDSAAMSRAPSSPYWVT